MDGADEADLTVDGKVFIITIELASNQDDI